MEAILKRKKQRLVKLLTKVYYFTIIIGVCAFFTMLFIVSDRVQNHSASVKEQSILTLILVFIVIFILIGMVSGVFAQSYGFDLIRYKRRIKKYRSSIHFNRIIKLLKNRDYSEAIDLYNSMDSSDAKDSLYPYMLGVLANCDDPIRVKNANENLVEFINLYNPDEIFK